MVAVQDQGAPAYLDTYQVLTSREKVERQEVRKRMGMELNLDDGDTYLNEEGIHDRARGSEKDYVLSWIWYDQPEMQDDDPEYIDAVRVEWCKAKARMLRWKEEVLLLSEKLCQMEEYALWKAEWWISKVPGKDGMRSIGGTYHGIRVDEVLAEGLEAYALQQARFHRDRAVHLEHCWQPLIDHATLVIHHTPNIPPF
ncbi:hypothetical protein K435DRAFT_879246 [Dendrothele bispora CBS 962.96]|uniref:Uncharacterized protein n=1 Tax=Dendrothele bispora (strain CBS 962.96) TaxID=1314807 RepID=A0A4S8KMI6_DENBC|nr:hypothetical protein K435DRAFT_879246 [Dendrothele bispora CBS 962.96]